MKPNEQKVRFQGFAHVLALTPSFPNFKGKFSFLFEDLLIFWSPMA